MGAKKVPCSVCGKPCRGVICLACRKEHMRNREKCPICGKSKSHASEWCADCRNKQRAEKKENRITNSIKNAPEYKCQYCGKVIPWDHTFSYRIPKYCSLKCAGHAEKHNHPLWHTKEEILEKINKAIDDTGMYITREYVNKVLHISDKVLTRLGLSLVAINSSKGKTLAMSKSQKLVIDAKPYERHIIDGATKRGRTLGTKTIGDITIPWKSHKKWTKEELEATITAYIKVVKRSISYIEATDRLGIDEKSLKENHISIPDLNRLAGYPQTTGKSMYELKAKEILSKLCVGEWEMGKTFEDLKSPVSNRKMLIDLYNETLNVAIEIDGTEHYTVTESDACLKAHERDRAKDKWAENSSVILIRIPTTPYDTFNKRVEKIGQMLKTLG